MTRAVKSLFLLAATFACAARAEASPSPEQLLAEINRIRADPRGYAADLRRYRSYFRGGIVYFPGNPVGLRTREGVAAVDEAIAILSRTDPLPPLASATVLAGAAGDHVAAQGPTGRTGHDGPDGSGPGVRVQRRGGGAYVAEVIAYGSEDAREAARQLIIDDGVPSRGHRLILLSERFRHAGAACGRHSTWRSMCVVNLSTTANGR